MTFQPLTCRRLAALLAGLCLPLLSQAAPMPRPPESLCIDDQCGQGAPAPGMIKWHPGHYMMIRSRHRDPAKELPQIDAIGKESTVKGVLIAWMWRDLETGKGQYDFSSVDQYLKRIKALPGNKKLIIHVFDRAWSSSTSVTAPDYLRSDPAYNGGEIPMANGSVSRIWEQPVMDRLIALYQALAKRYEGDPSVEGVQFGETAIGWSDENPKPSSYSDGAQAAQLKRLISAVRKAWPTSGVFMSTNYLGSDELMEDLIKYCVANKVMLGGPDTWTRAWIESGKRAVQADQIMRGERGSKTDYRKTAGIKGEIQTTELGGYIATFTPQELYDVAFNINKSQYIFWDRNDFYGGAAQKWTTGILPFIRSVNGKTYTDCPSSFGSPGCKTN